MNYFRTITALALALTLSSCGRLGSPVEPTKETAEQAQLIDGFIAAYSVEGMTPLIHEAKTNEEFIKVMRKEHPDLDIFEVLERGGFLFLCFRVKPEQKPGDANNLLNSIIIEKKSRTYRIQALAKS